MPSLKDTLAALPLAQSDPIAAELVAILAAPTSVSSAGFPYLEQRAWERFRDHVPHLLGMGLRTYGLVDRLEQQAATLPATAEDRESFARGCKVARQVIFTAAITAPTDLWLMHYVLGFFADLGLTQRLLEGDALFPDCCRAEVAGRSQQLVPEELEKDLHFLLSRGVVEQYDNSYRIAGHQRARKLLAAAPGWVEPVGTNPSWVWRKLFVGHEIDRAEQERLLDLAFPTPRRGDRSQNHWMPTRGEVAVAYRLVPVVLGLRAAERTAALTEGVEVSPSEWSGEHPVCAGGALEILTAAGWMERDGERYRVTPVGARGFARGPGPFGIIETYFPYMIRGKEILLQGRGNVWVERGENVAASQDANRSTFRQANRALDRFCGDTGFSYAVFIEHAIGRGEATRQRFELSGEDTIRYFGADLEDAAIDAAVAEQQRGNLPANLTFVRNADIGDPSLLIDALRATGVDPHGAVMLVGNGFHEVRDQSDDRMTAVFRGYHDAGILLLFTEENALSIDDLRATAFNTYHAGFRYVHEKSGQGLRPADPVPPGRLGDPQRAAWSECATQAGYLRADHYCSRTRTIYPYPPRSGHNPSISANHFFIPRSIASGLGLAD